MGEDYSVLAINVGSTSTKLGLYKEGKLSRRWNIPCTVLAGQGVQEQLETREIGIMHALYQERVDLGDIDIFVSRGGLCAPGPSGVYRINRKMCDDLLSGRFGWHPSALGPSITLKLAGMYGKQAVVVDPPSTDELQDIARVTGIPSIERKSAFHALNQKAAARKACKVLGKPYDKTSLVVAHMGGGITIGAHKKGRVIDATHGLSEGPFTPERAGQLPTLDIVDLVLSQGKSPDYIKSKLSNRSGLFAYLGTKDAQRIEAMIEQGDRNARTVYMAMAYQASKCIGAMSVVLEGNVDAIVLTGGLANSKMLVSWITRMVGFIADIMVYPGEDEIAALVEGGLRVLTRQESLLDYPSGNVLHP